MFATPLTVAHDPDGRIGRRDELRIVREDETKIILAPDAAERDRAVALATSARDGGHMDASDALSDERVMQNGSTAVVTAGEVTRCYGEGDTRVDALRGVNLDVERGKLTAVMGPSGSGKSTLMHILAALDKPTSGSVTIDGTEVTTLGDTQLTKLRRKHIGFVFQFFNLLPMLTAEENVRLPLTIAGTKPDKEFFEDLLRKVGLTDRRSHRPSELSGGQQQRVAIARALVSQPTVVFADEPTGNLDSATSGEILELMRASVDELGQTTVMVTHDARAASIADRILFLADGLIVKDMTGATASEVIAEMDELTLP
jgi:putative ABC transport system ATP-binding protein